MIIPSFITPMYVFSCWFLTRLSRSESKHALSNKFHLDLEYFCSKHRFWHEMVIFKKRWYFFKIRKYFLFSRLKKKKQNFKRDFEGEGSTLKPYALQWCFFSIKVSVKCEFCCCFFFYCFDFYTKRWWDMFWESHFARLSTAISKEPKIDKNNNYFPCWNIGVIQK